MAARIRLFISIKSQSVQIRRCNIGRGGRSCLVFENPFGQFGERGLVLVSSNSMAKNWILNQRLVANQNLHILCFGISLDLSFFLGTEEDVVPLDIKLLQATDLGPGKKSIFLALLNIQKRIWFGLCFLIQEAKVSITWQYAPKSARACTWPRSRWTSW